MTRALAPNSLHPDTVFLRAYCKAVGQKFLETLIKPRLDMIKVYGDPDDPTLMYVDFPEPIPYFVLTLEGVVFP